ncbi:MAG: GNAT family N-acetyltransferase, partial [Ilumatobacteraceae bacterium]
VDALYDSARADGDRRLVGSSGSSCLVRRVSVEDVRPLRLDVLRRGMANRVIDFDGDDEPTTVHLAAFDGSGSIVGVSTWMMREHVGDPGASAIQLRGMATARHLQGRGIGAILLGAGLDLAKERGATLVWANARDAALAFYQRHGFEVVGEGFIESVTSLPHHRVVRRID